MPICWKADTVVTTPGWQDRREEQLAVPHEKLADAVGRLVTGGDLPGLIRSVADRVFALLPLAPVGTARFAGLGA